MGPKKKAGALARQPATKAFVDSLRVHPRYCFHNDLPGGAYPDIWKLPLRPRSKLLLLVIALLTDYQGITCPSVEFLASKTGMSVRYVKRLLRELYAEKYLVTGARRP